MTKFSMADNTEEIKHTGARFTVFGLGGGGGNAVEHMVRQGIKNVTFVVANTDRQALDGLSVPNKLQLGAQTNRGLGAGADPKVGREAAESDEDAIRKLLENSDMVFVTAGMGGGTGTGAAPVVARIAKELGILTVAVVTTPFRFEGGRRIKAAQDGIEQLTNFVDSIITIPNDKLMKVYGNISMEEAFKKADDVLMHAVQGLAETIERNGKINIDFNDIRTALTAKGHAMMGIGRGSGDDRARQATEKAIRSPLLDDLLLENAKGLLVNVMSSSSLTLDEFSTINEILESITDTDDAHIFYGSVIDEDLGDDLHVTVIATGLTLDNRPKPIQQPNAIPNANSRQTIDPNSHASALSNQRRPASSSQSHSSQSHSPLGNGNTQIVSGQPQSQPQSQTRPRTNSITDYLRSQQNK